MNKRATTKTQATKKEATKKQATTPADKVCARCGRAFSWRAKWARDWESVRYCSDACRRHKLDDVDTQLEATILALLAARAAQHTICPSEAARSVASTLAATAATSGGPDEAWRALMEPARQAARRLVATGAIDIVQGGVVVDGDTARGPIRLRRRRA